MARRPTIPIIRLAGFAAFVPLSLPACQTHEQAFKQRKEIDDLKLQLSRLERDVAERDGTIAHLEQQIELLQEFGDDRPLDLFAPVELEIASLSGGADYDGKPGDDGVTVHLRIRDRDGDAVKAPGQIRVQLLDNTELGSPRSLAVCEVTDPEQLRRVWHGRFATGHYTVKCPFSPGVTLPSSRKVTVNAEFIDYLTGAPLTAVGEVDISFPVP